MGVGPNRLNCYNLNFLRIISRDVPPSSDLSEILGGASTQEQQHTQSTVIAAERFRYPRHHGVLAQHQLSDRVLHSLIPKQSGSISRELLLEQFLKRRRLRLAAIAIAALVFTSRAARLCPFHLDKAMEPFGKIFPIDVSL